MSGADAILLVTERLIELLEQHFEDHDMDVPVVAESPLTSEKKAGDSGTKLTLFLYMLRRDEYRQYPPGITWGDGRTGYTERPQPVALKLYYLITAFGEDQVFQQRLLGHAMQVMANHPTLERDPQAGPTSVETQQVVLLDLDIAAINAIWNTTTAVRETSVAYEISSVLLEPDARADRAIPPVQEVAITGASVPTLRQPAVPFLHAGQRVTLLGNGLDLMPAADVRVVFRDIVGGGYRDTAVPVEGLSANTIEVVVPELVYGGQLWVQYGSLQSSSVAWARTRSPA